VRSFSFPPNRVEHHYGGIVRRFNVLQCFVGAGAASDYRRVVLVHDDSKEIGGPFDSVVLANRIAPAFDNATRAVGMNLRH